MTEIIVWILFSVGSGVNSGAMPSTNLGIYATPEKCEEVRQQLFNGYKDFKPRLQCVHGTIIKNW